MKLSNPSLKRATTLLVCASVVLLAACASFKPKTPEEVVKERATARWQALIPREYAKAYTFLAPSYRKLASEDRYASSFGTAVIWKSAEVVGVTCEPEKCTARVKIESQPSTPTLFRGTITTHVDEEWLLEDGQWWLYQKL